MKTFLIFTQLEESHADSGIIYPNIIQASNLDIAVMEVLGLRENHKAIAVSYPSSIHNNDPLERYTAILALKAPEVQTWSVGTYQKLVNRV